jgi:hypothetical protein
MHMCSEKSLLLKWRIGAFHVYCKDSPNFTMPGLVSIFQNSHVHNPQFKCSRAQKSPVYLTMCASRSRPVLEPGAGCYMPGFQKFIGQLYYACLSTLCRNYNTGIERLCFPLSKAHCLCRHVSLEKSLLWKSTWNGAISGLAFLPDSST